MNRPRLTDFDAAIAWVEHDGGGGFIPARAEVIGMDHVRRVWDGKAIQALASPEVVDARFVFTHWVRTRDGAFLLGSARPAAAATS